jgi:phosphoribosylformylglycinamidine cyclo-ligase
MPERRRIPFACRYHHGMSTAANEANAVSADANAAKNRPAGGLTYAQAGVDMEAGDRVVDLIKPALRRTHSSRVLGAYGSFAAMFRLDFKEKMFKRDYKDPVLVACTDGVGTKVVLAVELGKLDSIGIDCVAMNVNDLIVQGAEPLFFLDYLGLSRIRPEETATIIRGVAEGCEIAGCSLIGGECAEMPDIYKPGDFDIAGFAVGVVEMDRAIEPKRVKKGDVIIGLASSGVHSNGYALVRRIIKQAKLDLHGVYPELGPRPLGDILEPTRIYAKPIVKLMRSYKLKRVVTGMAHITGAGIEGNLPRAFPEKFNAVVDRSSWQVPPIFKFLQERGGVDEAEMWRVFNMGVGYCVIVRPDFAKGVMKKLRKHGEKPWVMGEIEKGTGQVRFAE